MDGPEVVETVVIHGSPKEQVDETGVISRWVNAYELQLWDDGSVTWKPELQHPLRPAQ